MTRARVLLVLLVMASGAALRFGGLGWGLPRLYHCDERRIIQSAWRYATGQTTVPSDGVYTPLPSYVARIAHRASGGRVCATLPRTARFLRTCSALASLLSIPLLGLAVVPLLGWGAGIAASAFLAWAPGAVREAHFATVDSTLTFALVAVGSTALRVLWKARWPWWPLLPLAVGLAVATKVNAVMGVGALLVLAPGVNPSGSWRRLVVSIPLCAGLAVLLAWNMVARPRQYAFWLGMSGLARTGATIPYCSLNFWRPQPLEGMVSLLWMCGPALFVLGVIGLPLFLCRMAGRPLVPLAAVFLGSTLELFTGRIPYVRVALPLVPLLALAAGSLADRLWGTGTGGKVVAALAVVGTLVSGMAYATFSLRPDARDVAAHWLAGRWQEGEVVLLDGQDELVPIEGIPASAQVSMRHPAQQLLNDPSALDRPGLPNRILLALAEWGATRPKEERLLHELRVPWRGGSAPERRRVLEDQIKGVTWIVTTLTERDRYAAHRAVFGPELSFYDDLLSNRLGFSVVASFGSGFPPLPPWIAPEVSWRLFDHPAVLVLRHAPLASHESLGAP